MVRGASCYYGHCYVHVRWHSVCHVFQVPLHSHHIAPDRSDTASTILDFWNKKESWSGTKWGNSISYTSRYGKLSRNPLSKSFPVTHQARFLSIAIAQRLLPFTRNSSTIHSLRVYSRCSIGIALTSSLVLRFSDLG